MDPIDYSPENPGRGRGRASRSLLDDLYAEWRLPYLGQRLPRLTPLALSFCKSTTTF